MTNKKNTMQIHICTFEKKRKYLSILAKSIRPVQLIVQANTEALVATASVFLPWKLNCNYKKIIKKIQQIGVFHLN